MPVHRPARGVALSAPGDTGRILIGCRRRVAGKPLGITPELVPGGHLLALSRPRELVAALLG